ncbi:twin-arginine translocase subunit TatC [Jeotgalibacillus campisalis]|uniref:Sec-independent protein translocase protein TatC n=1 Tax=Jeotgalibacillus campisalis TaxID=220754 RepID=A0A0C2S2U5_9BACL|nr:twin-arginine translocase subunit TatC [Jeotgalibacillus campisalis]KIL48339.1 preprotein translocase subunit TatC [Jeotgalibacillus campisalis]
MNEKDMSVHDHINEIRKRLILVVVFFVFAIAVGFFLAEPLMKFLQSSDEAQQMTLNAFRVTDPVKIYFQIILFIAFIMTAPLILFQLWSFVSPGLHERERRVTLSYIPASALLFLGGLAFAYFILFPFVVQFMMNLSDNLGIEQVIGINEYFQFLFQMTIPFGFLFQLPVIMLFVTRLGIVTPMVLSKIRKYAYFVLIVVAAFVTPPDIFSHLLVTVPLLVLYEISLWIAKIGYRKALKAEAKQREIDEKERRERIDRELANQKSSGE